MRTAANLSSQRAISLFAILYGAGFLLLPPGPEYIHQPPNARESVPVMDASAEYKNALLEYVNCALMNALYYISVGSTCRLIFIHIWI